MKYFYFFMFVCIFSASLFSLEFKNLGFPFKRMVYDALRLSGDEIKNVTIKKDTAKIFEFTYQGKSYRAEVFVYGAIYLEREGQNPLLLSFDIREYRFGSRFIALREW